MNRFLLDEHVPHAIAHGLRLRGVEVVTATDAGLLSQSDEVVATYAVRQALVIFTQDDDFLKLAARGMEHGGIVFSKQERRSLEKSSAFLNF